MGSKFILFLLLVHGAALALSFYVFRENKLFFIIAEAVILISIAIGVQLYREFIEPLKLLISGIDAIKDQDFNVKFLPTGKYETDKLISVYNQMIDRLREERTKQEQQHFFLGKLIQTSPTGIIILDYDARIVEINPKAREMLGIGLEEQVEERALESIDHPIARAAARLPSGQTRTVHIQGMETYKCRKTHFIDRGFARPFVTIEELTAEILRAEKNAYGKVIRMMAHEVNNSIGAINSILQAALSYSGQMIPADGREFQEALDVCIERNDRLNRFMRNFADIVRLPTPVREQYSLNRLVQGVVNLMQGQAHNRQITLTAQIPDHLVWASIDVQQMELVLVNAVKNALEAVGRHGSVELKIGDQPLTILISDSGSGIPEGMEEQIFSPFFTTKPDGQGIGLTLSREILLNHGFGFSLKNRPEGGAEFRIVMG